MDNVNVERIEPEQSLEKNGAFVILYSDDFEQDAENKKVLMLLHWNGVFGFVGKEKEDDESYIDTLVNATKEQIDFDLKPYSDKIEHLASYSYNGYGIHTYVCKITAEEMKAIRAKAHNSEDSVFNYSAITVFNISPQTVENVLNNNFGATSGMDLFEFIDKYISVEFERIMEQKQQEQKAHEVEVKATEREDLAIELEGLQTESPPPKNVIKGVSMSYSFKPNQK